MFSLNRTMRVYFETEPPKKCERSEEFGLVGTLNLPSLAPSDNVNEMNTFDSFKNLMALLLIELSHTCISIYTMFSKNVQRHL